MTQTVRGHACPVTLSHVLDGMRVIASPAMINRWLNPYNWLLNTHLEREGVEVVGAAPWRVLRGQGDIWHLHWPDHVFNQGSVTRASLGSRTLLHLAREGRRRGLRIVWTVHNLRAHDGRHAELERHFWTQFLPTVDGLIHLSDAGRTAANAQFPELADRPAWVIPHGHYRSEYVTTQTREDARSALGIAQDAQLVLFTGRVRPYKNVPGLLEAFRGMPGANARCLVTGSPATADLRSEIEELAARDHRVRLDLRHLRQRELASALRACDLVVLPYREILNSGSALLALSLDRPVLVPRRGAMAELARDVGCNWVRCYDGELTSEALADALRWARESVRTPRAPLDRFDWPAIARDHRDAYASVAGGDGTVTPMAMPSWRPDFVSSRLRTPRLATS